MPDYESKADFPRTATGKVLLTSPADIACWITLGYREQLGRHPGEPERLKIDLAGCDLTTHVARTSRGAEVPSFSLSMLAGLAAGIEARDGTTLVKHPVEISDSILHTPCFHHLVCKGPLTIRRTAVAGYMTIVDDTVAGDVCLSELTITGKLLIQRCTFSGQFKIKVIPFYKPLLSIKECRFEGAFSARSLLLEPVCGKPPEAAAAEEESKKRPCCLTVERTVFSERMSLEDCRIMLGALVKRTEFSRQAVLKSNAFGGPLLLEQCTVRNDMSFESAYEARSIGFRGLVLDGRLHFNRIRADRIEFAMCSIAQTGRLKFTAPQIAALTITESVVSGRVDMAGGRLGLLGLRETLCDGYMTLLDTDCARFADSYTARLLKDRALATNDIIRALDYRKAEMNLYFRELLRRRAAADAEGCETREPLSAYLRRLPAGKITLLLFNKLSNDYGKSWGRGILFTAAAAALFFAPLWQWGLDASPHPGWSDFGTVWKGYLQTLNIANWKDTLGGFDLNALGATLFYLSRVFISYGIYQTVAAFRKYGR